MSDSDQFEVERKKKSFVLVLLPALAGFIILVSIIGYLFYQRNFYRDQLVRLEGKPQNCVSESKVENVSQQWPSELFHTETFPSSDGKFYLQANYINNFDGKCYMEVLVLDDKRQDISGIEAARDMGDLSCNPQMNGEYVSGLSGWAKNKNIFYIDYSFLDRHGIGKSEKGNLISFSHLENSMPGFETHIWVKGDVVLHDENLEYLLTRSDNEISDRVYETTYRLYSQNGDLLTQKTVERVGNAFSHRIAGLDEFLVVVPTSKSPGDSMYEEKVIEKFYLVDFKEKAFKEIFEGVANVVGTGCYLDEVSFNKEKQQIELRNPHGCVSIGFEQPLNIPYNNK